MATWGVHIRIAEEIIKTNDQLDTETFLVGNLGPDCGVPNEDWSQFNPPGTITHFRGNDKEIQADIFYREYLTHKIGDSKRFSFFIRILCPFVDGY